MPEGNRRQAAIIFVIAGIFLVGLLLVGLGIVKQQSKNVAPAQPNRQTNKPTEKKPEKKEEQKPLGSQPKASEAPRATPAPQATQQPPSRTSPQTPAPQIVPTTGPATLPATGLGSDLVIGTFSFILAAFMTFRFLQSKQALQPKL
ncbi:MAG TPA: hypothetical protein VFZ58_02600 [Candidatus Saccharimonadales bacterium]